MNNITYDKLQYPLSDQEGSGKSFRIIANQWLQNQSDFDNLFGIAQRISLTSGDNTLNNAFGKGVVPIYATQIWNIEFRDKLIEDILLLSCVHKEEKIINELRNLLTDIMPVNDSDKAHETIISNLSNALNKLQENNKEMLNLLHAVITEIQLNHNFDTKSMPIIVNIINKFINEEETIDKLNYKML